MKTFSILLWVILFSMPSYGQGTIVLKPFGNMGSDVLIWNLEPDSNMASWPEIKMLSWTFGSIPGVQRSLLDFNLGLLPPNSVISSAYLSLYGNSGSTEFHSTQSGTNECFIKRIISAWNPAAVTWNTQPATDFVNAAVIPPSTGPYDDYLNINVTALVQDLYANQGNYQGMMIELVNETDLRRMVFKSADQPDSSKFPTLTIQYSPVGLTENTTATMFQVYPNPSNGFFTIKPDNTFKAEVIEIINPMGEIVYEKFISSEDDLDIGINTIASGVYFIKMQNSRNSYCRKLVIH